MPFIRFNLEGSKTEEAARIRTLSENGLVRVRAERRPTTVLELTMTPGQALAYATLLKEEALRASKAVADRRPRLAEDGR